MTPPNYKPSRNIKDAVPELQKAWPLLLEMYEKAYEGCTLNITCSHRTPEEQYELYKQGRTNVGELNSPVWVPIDYAPEVPYDKREQTVTNCDGTIKVSAHNYYPARAIDVVVVDANHKENWNDARYYVLVDFAKRLGLVSGGGWTAFKDWPHIEVPNYKTYRLPKS